VRQWIIQAARELRLMPTSEGSLDLWLDMTMGQDGYSGTEHNPAGGAAVRRRGAAGRPVEDGDHTDLVVLDRNPLVDLRNSNSVRWVMKNGRLYDGSSLDEQWPERRPARGFYWQSTDVAPERTTGAR
jgi:hypothetical protein